MEFGSSDGEIAFGGCGKAGGARARGLLLPAQGKRGEEEE